MQTLKMITDAIITDTQYVYNPNDSAKTITDRANRLKANYLLFYELIGSQAESVEHFQLLLGDDQMSHVVFLRNINGDLTGKEVWLDDSMTVKLIDINYLYNIDESLHQKVFIRSLDGFTITKTYNRDINGDLVSITTI